MSNSHFVETSISNVGSDDSGSTLSSRKSSISAEDASILNSDHEEMPSVVDPQNNCLSSLLEKLLQIDFSQTYSLRDRLELGIGFLVYFQSLEFFYPKQNLDEKVDVLSNLLPRDIAELQKIQLAIVDLLIQIPSSEGFEYIKSMVNQFYMAVQSRIFIVYEMQVSLIKSQFENDVSAIREKEEAIRQYGYPPIQDDQEGEKRAILYKALELRLGEEDRSRISLEKLIQAFYSVPVKQVPILSDQIVQTLQSKVDRVYLGKYVMETEVILPILYKIMKYQKDHYGKQSYFAYDELRDEKLKLMQEGREILSNYSVPAKERLAAANKLFLNNHTVFLKNNDTIILEVAKMIAAGLIIAMSSLLTFGFAYETSKTWVQTRLFKTKSSLVLDSLKKGREIEAENTRNISYQATCS